MTAVINHSENKISMDELIFINKEYGAYKLRRNYGQNLSVSLFITVILFTGLISYTLFNKKNEATLPFNGNKLNVPIDLSDIKIEKIDLESLSDQLVRNFKPMVKFVDPKVVEDYKSIEEATFPTQEDLTNKIIGTTNLDGDPNGMEISPGEILPSNEISTTVKPDNKIYTWLEEMPSFQGSDQALQNFIMKNIHYPGLAVKAGVKGRVMVSFIVEKDGSLSDITVLKSIGGGCDEEAVRVLKLTGNWNPGKQNGIPVRVRMSIPFCFQFKINFKVLLGMKVLSRNIIK